MSFSKLLLAVVLADIVFFFLVVLFAWTVRRTTHHATLPRQTLACPVCGMLSPLEVQCREVALHRCSTCDHCFTDVRSILPEAYHPAYFQETHRNYFLHPDRKLYRRLERIIYTHNPHASVLDVGCGTGSFLTFLGRTHVTRSLTGLDVADVAHPNGFAFIRGDLLTASIPYRYDVVTSLTVIEHLADVRGFVQRLSDLCTPGGLIIIHTDNTRSLVHEAARLLYRHGITTPFERLYEPHHLNHFTYASLERLIARSPLITLTHTRHNMPLKSVDVPTQSPFVATVLRAGVGLLLLAGRVTGQTFMQTIICRNPEEKR